jgi:hypothetical protein
MKRILVLYYSQSGDVAKAADALLAPLAESGAQVVCRRIEPATPYPFPWRSVDRFFDVMPECVVGEAPEIQSLDLAPDDRFDLVVLAWQVWFLSPSLPAQGLFQSPAARVLKDTPVVTLSVSRNMRHLAGRRMRRLLHEVGAIHVGEIAVTHQGSPLATFLSTPRSLLTGRRDRMWGVLPPTGVAKQSHHRLEQIGRRIAAALMRTPASLAPGSLAPGLLDDFDAAPVNTRYLLSELSAWPSFFVWARIIRLLGRLGRPWRTAGVYAFAVWLVLCILVFVPLGIVLSPAVFVWSQLAKHRSRARRRRFRSPGNFLPTPMPHAPHQLRS